MGPAELLLCVFSKGGKLRQNTGSSLFVRSRCFVFFSPHFALPGFHVFLICLRALGQLDSCRRFSPFMINEVAIAVISPTSWMWAGDSRRGKIPLRTPTNPAWRYSTLAFYIFFFSLFFSDGERGSDADYFERFFARPLGYVLWESGFPTIVSSLVARYWQSFVWMCVCVCGEQTPLIPESRAGRGGRVTSASSFQRRDRPPLRSCCRPDCFSAFFVASLRCPPGFFAEVWQFQVWSSLWCEWQ